MSQPTAGVSDEPAGLTRNSLSKIYALFLVSGISGLIYQVIWIRQFSYIFGNSIYSAAIVTALFMAGLGLGGWAAGGYVDAKFRKQPAFPLYAYAWCEIAIGASGLFTAWLLPNLGAFSATAASYVTSANGWHTLSFGSNALRYLVPVVLLIPVTALMGATLTLLIRFVVWNEVRHAGFRIGLLYGFNTAGAALGCLATDLLLIPRLGLFLTQCGATLGNFLAAGAALHLAKGFAQLGVSPVAAVEPQIAVTPTTRASGVLLAACGAVSLAGAVGMGMEIVWFRYLISMLGAYREVFSLLLGMILVGIWGGATLAGILQRRFGRPSLLFAFAQCILIVSCALPLMLITRGGLSEWRHSTWRHFNSAPFWTQSLAEIALAELIPIALVTAVPAWMMGMSFPLANAVVQQQASHIGRRAGLLYASNTTGAVLGALVSGFWLLPQAGTQLSVLVWMCCSFLALLPLALLETSRGARACFVATAAVAGLVLIAWVRLPSNWLIEQTIPPDAKGEQILAASEGIGETIVIAKGQRGMRLVTNGHNMSATSILGQRYMRLFSHLPLLQAPQATDALVICYGVGNTLNATLLHPQLQRVDLVDISAHVLSHAHHFKEVNGEPLRDPRVSVFINDGRQHLRMVEPEQYDLITAEPPPIAHAGVAGLYSVEFYQLARSRLKGNGVMTHWLPINQVPGTTGLSVVRAFLEVFPNAILLNGANNQLILVGKNGPTPFQLDPAVSTAALAANPAVLADLRRVGADTLLDLAALFVSSPASLGVATRSVRPVTDDYPIIEYDAYHPLRGREPIAAELFQPLADFDVWCPRCGEPAWAESLADLGAYSAVLSQFYQSEAYLVRNAGQIKLKVDSRARQLLAHNKYLQLLFSGAD